MYLRELPPADWTTGANALRLISPIQCDAYSPLRLFVPDTISGARKSDPFEFPERD
jgi:hypothetical protein